LPEALDDVQKNTKKGHDSDYFKARKPYVQELYSYVGTTMSLDERYKRKKWPKDKPSLDEENPSVNPLHDILELVREVNRIVTSDIFEYAESSQRTEGISEEPDYVIPKPAERTQVPVEHTELPSESPEGIARDPTAASVPISQHGKDEAGLAEMMRMAYLKGISEYGKLNLDDAVKHLIRCYEMAVKTGSREYSVSSQSQLATIYLKRYQMYGLHADYGLACIAIDTLREMGVDTKRLVRT